MNPTKQIKIEQMVPTNFEPKTNRRFILTIPGIDAFLIKSVHTPALQPNEQGKLVPKKFHFLRVFLYCPIVPSAEQMISEVLEQQSKNGTFLWN